VVEIGGAEIEAIIREAIRRNLGRELDQITWVNVVERRTLGKVEPDQDININATLKPKE
jgi:hypothetical protein